MNLQFGRGSQTEITFQYSRKSDMLNDEVRALASGGKSSDVIYETVRKSFFLANKNAALLDFGCGRGNFLRLLERDGYKNLSGMDIYDRADSLPKGANYLKANLNQLISSQDQLFDIVFAIEVIEHLENPRQVLREIARLLKPGGRLYLTTPNNESIRSYISLLFRGHYWAFCGSSYPAHITALLESDLKRVTLEAGLKIELVTFTNSGAIVGFPGTTWQRWLGPLAKGRYFSDNILVVASKPN